MKLHKIAFILLVIGGLNWLIIGLMPSWDLATYITSGVARVVYILVGLSALIEIFGHKRRCKECMGKGGQM